MNIAISDQINVEYEVFGRDEDPTVILLMGAMNPGLFWPDTFCGALVNSGGLRVVRFDQRDTGLSTKVDYSKHPYSLTDLADDVTGLADALDIDQFHLVGLSLGGAVAQIVVSRQPDRCLTLTLVGSTIDSRPYNAAMSGSQGNAGPLSRPSPELIHYAESMRDFIPESDSEAFEATVEGWRHFYGDGGFPEQEVRLRVRKAMALQEGSTSGINHAFAAAIEAEREHYAKRIMCPTLIIHGTQDKAFGVDHAKHSQKVISESRLLTIKGMGHMPDDDEFLSIAEGIVQHIHQQ